jgi:hypothetical protein
LHRKQTDLFGGDLEKFVLTETAGYSIGMSYLCDHANLLFGPMHPIVHWLPNKRFAWPQSYEGFVNMAPELLWTDVFQSFAK